MDNNNLKILGINPKGSILHCCLVVDEETEPKFFTIDDFHLGNFNPLLDVIKRYNVNLLSIVNDDRIFSKGYRKIAANANTIAAICILCKDNNLNYEFYNANNYKPIDIANILDLAQTTAEVLPLVALDKDKTDLIALYAAYAYL